MERTGFKSLLETSIKSTNFNDATSRNAFVDHMYKSFPTVADLSEKCPDLLQCLQEFYNINFSTFKSIVVRSSPTMQGVSVFQ